MKLIAWAIVTAAAGLLGRYTPHPDYRVRAAIRLAARRAQTGIADATLTANGIPFTSRRGRGTWKG